MKNKIAFLSFFAFVISAKEHPVVSLNYISEPLVNIVNKLASLKGANIVLPLPKDTAKASGPAATMGTTSKASQDFFDIKVNLYREDKVKLSEAWNILTLMLNVSGYSIYKRGSGYQVEEISKSYKAPLPLYIDTPLAELPDNNEQIRYVHYFDKISISNKTGSAVTNLKNMLAEMLSGDKTSTSQASASTFGGSTTGSASITNLYELNSQFNSLILTNPSSNIKSVMQIIDALENQESNEVVEVVPIKHSNPNYIEKILTQLIKNTEEGPFVRFGAPAKQGSKNAFSDNARAISIERMKSIALVGGRQSVAQLKKFIKEKLDVAVRTGLNLLHVKPIRYLKASDLITPLKAIVKNQTAQQSSGYGGYGQSRQTTPQDEFSKVIITSEVEEKSQTGQGGQQGQGGWGQQQQSTPATPIMGGNNVIVAAPEREWIAIERLIDDLDKPQLQVALEVLIADVTVNDDQIITAQLRNPTDLKKPGTLNWQQTSMASLTNTAASAMVSDRTLDGQSYQTLAADLGDKIVDIGNSETGFLARLATINQTAKGSTVFTFNNGESGISAMLQILDKIDNTTIISQPFVIASNNQKANITSKEIRWVDGGISAEAGATGNLLIKKEKINAELTVNITPRINKNSEEVNLEIEIKSDDFAGTSSNNKLTRHITTNSHLKNKQVLVLGGLTRKKYVEIQFGTPFLSSIPIIGSLFKERTKDRDKKMLMVFISPTIIKPYLKKERVNEFTREKLNYSIKEMHDNEKVLYGDNFEGLTDPITRLFFDAEQKNFDADINNYAATGVYYGRQELPDSITGQRQVLKEVKQYAEEN